MARRKDHTPQALKSLIHEAAQKIIFTKGLNGLTARSLAKAIGYTPGTIYNFYRDMDALVTDVNYGTLDALEKACRASIAGLPSDFSKIRSLAYAYVDFSHAHIRAWETLFSGTRISAKPIRLPKAYQEKIVSLFQLIEEVLIDSMNFPVSEAHRSARLLWASLHGITVLTLDGRLKLVGIEQPHQIIDNLLERYFSVSIKEPVS